MLANQHAALTGSGDSGIKLLSAWHAKATDGLALAFNIREDDGAGRIIVPISLPATTPGSQVGTSYEHPLETTLEKHWYVEFVSGAGTVTLSGRY